MRSRRNAFIVLTTAVLGAALWLAPISSASVANVTKQCAKGRAAKHKLKPSEVAFVRKYLHCVLSRNGLRPHPRNTIGLVGKPITGPGAGGYEIVPRNFPKYMAPTIAGFAKAPRSAGNLKYIDRKITEAFQETNDGVYPGYYWAYGDTTPPRPTLKDLAVQLAPARKAIARWHKPDRMPKLAISVVVQKGVWFHNGRGANLRYFVVIKAVA